VTYQYTPLPLSAWPQDVQDAAREDEAMKADMLANHGDMGRLVVERFEAARAETIRTLRRYWEPLL